MGIRTSEQYKESLRDGRVVYFGGKRVEDITRHPSLRVTVEQCAMDYVLAADPRFRDLFVERNEEGEPVSFVYLPCRSATDL